MINLYRLGLKLGMGAALLTSVGTASAKVTWDLQPSGTGAYDWTIRQHWRFDVPNAPFGACNGCSYHPLGSIVSWGGPGKAAPECLDVTTYPGNPWGTPNPDTVIEVSDATNHFQVINDDYGGTLQSRARIWIGGQRVSDRPFAPRDLHGSSTS